jgi:DNA-binding transcriptional MerR regulator/methylmalonyl-CoA mutase cobalamin-binding subunit
MYTISEAADRAGVSVDVMRAWERRYGVVTPQRTATGYRLYDIATINRIRAMRQLVEDGWSPSAAAAHVREAPVEEIAEDAPRHQPAVDDIEADPLVDRFVRAAADLDAAALTGVLDEMAIRSSFEPMIERHLFPALRALGAAWASGDVSVAAEHAATAAVARWLGTAFEAAAADRQGDRPILVGLPPGARHELGALAFATACRRAGLAVQYLGADLPAADWARAARDTDATAAVIGVPTAADSDAARNVARALRRASPGLLVVFGGRGAADLRRATVLPTAIPDAVSEMVRFSQARAARRG